MRSTGVPGDRSCSPHWPPVLPMTSQLALPHTDGFVQSVTRRAQISGRTGALLVQGQEQPASPDPSVWAALTSARVEVGGAVQDDETQEEG